MFVFPVNREAVLAACVRGATRSSRTTSLELPPGEVDANRDAWIDEWTQIVLR